MTLDAVLAEAFRRIAAGATDRRSAFHTPTLATIGPDGAPEARTLVLRGFDRAARSLLLHSDRRSGKVAALAQDPRAALHVYDAAGKIQLRLSGRASLHAGDAIAEAGWAASRDMARMVYAIEPGPGSAVPAPPEAPRDPLAGRAHFTVIRLRFDALDWLELDAAGHRRAGFAWDADGGLSATWRVP